MSDSTYKKVKEYLVAEENISCSIQMKHMTILMNGWSGIRIDVEKFHHYKLYNGAVMTNQERYKLGMAKTVCEDWATCCSRRRWHIKAGKYSKRH